MEKIIIHSPEKIGGKKHVMIEVYFTYVGKIRIPFSKPEQRRTVLLMYFFIGYTDTEVGNEYGRCRSTANYWKHAALKQLRKEWLKSENEEQEADTL